MKYVASRSFGRFGKSSLVIIIISSIVEFTLLIIGGVVYYRKKVGSHFTKIVNARKVPKV